ncbi:MAG: LacI family DNA-binding transcriptional regulator [Anaerolineae bacterium]
MATITDVAKRAGVSPVTVSRVLNNASNVNPETRARVMDAIHELGYVPNVAARSLRSKRMHSLALILPDITNSFWTTVARGVEDAAQAHGYAVLLCNTDENLAKQAGYLRLVASQRVDGVIIAPCDGDPDHVASLRERDMPTVVIDRQVAGWEVDRVRGDSLSGAYALVRHLIGLGHVQIAMISGPCGTSTADERVAGYRLALAEAGLSVDERLVRRGEFRISSGAQMTRAIFQAGLRPTAIFAANNALAMGVIDAAGELGLRIPQDLALVCFDDLANSSRLFPFLTVAVQPAYEIGLKAAQLLLGRIETRGAEPPREIILPTRMIVRHSCGARFKEGAGLTLSLPLPVPLVEQSIQIPPLAVSADDASPERG